MSKSLRSYANPNQVAKARIIAGNAEIAKAIKEKRIPLTGLGYWGARNYLRKTSLSNI